MMLAENSLKGKGPSETVRRVCSTLIECLQNVSRHGWVDDEGEIQLYLTLEHIIKCKLHRQPG